MHNGVCEEAKGKVCKCVCNGDLHGIRSNDTVEASVYRENIGIEKWIYGVDVNGI